MKKITPCSIVNDLRENGDELKEYPEIISDLLLSFCKTEEYCTMNKYDQIQLIDRCNNIKGFIKDVLKLDKQEWINPCSMTT